MLRVGRTECARVHRGAAVPVVATHLICRERGRTDSLVAEAASAACAGPIASAAARHAASECWRNDGNDLMALSSDGSEDERRTAAIQAMSRGGVPTFTARCASKARRYAGRASPRAT